MTRTLEGTLDGKGVKVALIVSRFNEVITQRLLAGATECLERHGCAAQDQTVVRVPGAWELPQAAHKLAQQGSFDAIIALGAVIRGETPHFDVLAHQTARGLADVALRLGLPLIFGVLTTDTVEQAMARSGSKSGNRGWEAGLSALEMVSLFREMGEGRPRG